MKIICLIIMAIVLVGCQSPPSNFEVSKEGVILIKYDASKRGALLIPKDKKYKVIIEPSPDAGISSVHEILLAAGYKGFEGKANYKFGQDMIQLGQRSETVYLLREALFRLNVLSVNYDLPVEEAIKIYGEILLAAKELVFTDKEKAEADKINALNNAPQEIKELYIPEGMLKKDE